MGDGAFGAGVLGLVGHGDEAGGALAVDDVLETGVEGGLAEGFGGAGDAVDLGGEVGAAEGEDVGAEADDVAVALVEEVLGFVGWREGEVDGDEAVEVREAGDEGARDVGGDQEVVVGEEGEDEEGWEVEEEGEEHDCCLSRWRSDKGLVLRGGRFLKLMKCRLDAADRKW